MASLGDRAAIAIISTAHGAIKVLKNEKRFSQLNVRADLDDLYEYMNTAREKWCNSYTENDIQWTVMRLDSWGKVLREIGIPDHLQTTALVKVGTMALGDLLDKVNNPTKKRLVEAMFHKMEALDAMVDREGTAFLSLDLADEVLAELYKRINFIPLGG